VESAARRYVAGADQKATFYAPGSSQLTGQGEGQCRRSHAVDSASGVSSEDRRGLYAFVNYRHHTQYNVGVLYEQAEREGDPARVDQALKVFAGYAVLEESTLLRLAYERFMPEGEDAVNTVSLQLLFSMGPHKAHQF
jgi:hypothetical protein